MRTIKDELDSIIDWYRGLSPAERIAAKAEGLDGFPEDFSYIDIVAFNLVENTEFEPEDYTAEVTKAAAMLAAIDKRGV